MENVNRPRPYAQALERLRRVGLRPTRQRLALAKLLFEQGDRHVTAERLHEEAGAAKVRVSLATVYNSLHQFTQLGLLREVVVEAGRSYFDTNTSDHHHFFCDQPRRLCKRWSSENRQHEHTNCDEWIFQNRLRPLSQFCPTLYPMGSKA